MLVWLLCWLIIFLLLIVALATCSPIFIVFVIMLAVILGMAQCFFCTSDDTNEEQCFSAANPGAFEANKELTKAVEAYYENDCVYPPDTNMAAVVCASRGSDPEWHAGYELEPWSNEEQKLEEMALDSQAFAESQSHPEFIPRSCSTKPLPCEMRVAWQNHFVGCPSTFIECPNPQQDKECKQKKQDDDTQGVNIYKRDDRLWNRNLHDIQQERAVMSGEIWDPYKYFYARQKLAQILSEDLIHRKDKYMRPIETLEQAECFSGTNNASPAP